MTDQDNNSLLNSAVISMAHSLLQYVADAGTWVQMGAQGIEEQVDVLAARQRQDVGDVAALLTEREFAIDFGTFPTEYTDLQFLSLEALFGSIRQGQSDVLEEIAAAISALRQSGDAEAVTLLEAVEIHEKEIAVALQELNEQLQPTA